MQKSSEKYQNPETGNNPENPPKPGIFLEKTGRSGNSAYSIVCTMDDSYTFRIPVQTKTVHMMIIKSISN